MSLDLSIGRGDNAPNLTWAMPFAVAGSDFDLVLAMPGGMSLSLTVSGGGLTLDTVANTVIWPVTSAQSAALPYTSLYTLRRIVPGGEVRYYASGRIFGIDGPVGPSSVVVQVAGPQGPLPSNAQIVAAVESVIGQPGGIAGQDEVTAEIARAKAAEAMNASAITAEATRATGAESTIAASVAAQAPKTYAVTISKVGQTAIPLPVPPNVASSLRLIVRGFVYAAPDFTTSSTALTWAGPFPLEPADAVTLSYV